jgi:hypothetical protein
LAEGGDGVEFLGFDHRYVRGHAPVSPSHLPSPLALASGHGRARQPIREITAGSRLRFPVEVIVRDLNRFLGGGARCRFAELFSERELLPAGVLNVITRDGEPIGAEIPHHSDARMVSLTGTWLPAKGVARAVALLEALVPAG